jgi:hypothetical protein
MGCLAAVSGGCSPCRWCHSPDTPDPQRQECRDSHGFGKGSTRLRSALVAENESDCPRTQCGLNGIWLGQGVQFRTLHLTPGVPNSAGLSILGFEDRHHHPMTPDVDRDVLLGRPAGGGPPAQGECVSGGAANCLTGAELLLGSFNDKNRDRLTPQYRLKIQHVGHRQFWTQCNDCTDRESTPTYQFTAIKLDDSCEVEICKPGLADGFDGTLTGEAVIFRGDYYDELTHSVLTTGAQDEFNIACLGSTISKLHLLRHTTASLSATNTTTIDQRQTLLRLFTADYCGNGHGFTEDGLPIRLGINNAHYDLIQSSHYIASDAASVDALWSNGHATCLGTPRWVRGTTRSWTPDALRTEIRLGCAIPDCPVMTPVPLKPAPASSDYAITANPVPPGP